MLHECPTVMHPGKMVKETFALEEAIKNCRGSRGIALFFL
jgi:hypothetical protein